MSTNFQPIITYNQPAYQAIDLMTRAYRIAGALKHPGQGMTGSEQQEALDIANAFIDGLKTENLMIIYTRRTIQNMVANQQSYSIGPGQDFDLERPEKIHRAGFIVGTYPNEAELPMAIILTFEEWASFTVKNITSQIPLALYYQAAVPYGCVRVWPVPSQASQIAIYTAEYLSEFSTVDDNVIFPDGFREMFIYNLAVRIHQNYPEKPMDPSVTVMADQYKKRIKNNLLKPLFIGSDPAVLQETRNNSKGSGGWAQLWLPPWFR